MGGRSFRLFGWRGSGQRGSGTLSTWVSAVRPRWLENALDEQEERAELVRVHQEGWRQVADAISRGLGEIAKAVRQAR